MNLPLKQNSMIRKFSMKSLITLIVVLLALAACDERTVEKRTEANQDKPDSTKANIINVSGKLFSIPSPIQTALLIKESEADYRSEILSEGERYADFSTKMDKAMNLGVYGTDMAYSSLYDDGQRALRYFKAIENLANDLGVTAAIDADLIRRLGSNVGEADSLLYLTGRFYENADAYLKENERYDIAALVLLGGWIESAHLTVESAANGNEAAKKRLAEQKQALKTLVEVLASSADDTYKESSLKLTIDSLAAGYDSVAYSYEFVEPNTVADQRKTVIKSSSEFSMSEEHLNEVKRLIASARAQITGK